MKLPYAMPWGSAQYRATLAYPVYPGPDTRWHMVWIDHGRWVGGTYWYAPQDMRRDVAAYDTYCGPNFVLPCGHPQAGPAAAGEESCPYVDISVDEI